ncbi:MAG: hypothetical protein ABI906_08080, partial [Pseudomonadota bacterium]
TIRSRRGEQSYSRRPASSWRALLQKAPSRDGRALSRLMARERYQSQPTKPGEALRLRGGLDRLPPARGPAFDALSGPPVERAASVAKSDNAFAR